MRPRQGERELPVGRLGFLGLGHHGRAMLEGEETMRLRFTTLLTSALALGACAMLLAPATALAGQYKTLNTQTLGAGGQVTAYSSPKNTNTAMEMETYEFQTTAATASWRCRIITNQTTRALNVRLIGLTGAQLANCTTSAGGTCDTAAIALGGNFKFQCLVATGAGSPIPSDASWYRIAVQRVN
jgi:hypothetical protein